MKRHAAWENGTDKRNKLQANNYIETSFVRNIERPTDDGRRASTIREVVMIEAPPSAGCAGFCRGLR